MIDTDKYKGHTSALWDWFPSPNESLIGHLQRHSNLTRVIAEIISRSAEDDANAQLIADAPLLLAEVKRLREILGDIIAIDEWGGDGKDVGITITYRGGDSFMGWLDKDENVKMNREARNK